MKVSFKVTERCMANCSCCKSRLDLYKEKTNKGNLQDVSLELFNHVIQESSNHEEKFLSITGGEPTILEYLTELTKNAKENNFVVKVNTNGWDITYDKLELLAKNGMDILFLSLYSLDKKTFAELRGSEALYDRVFDSIKVISQYRQKSDKISARLQTVIMKPNFRELPAILKFAIESNFDAFSTMYLANVPSFPHLQLSVEEIKEFKNEIMPEMIKVIKDSNMSKDTKEIAKNQIMSYFPTDEISLENYSKGIYRPSKDTRCNKRNKFVAVYPNGDVYPCYCFDYIKEPKFRDNIEGKRLRDVFSGEAFSKFWDNEFDYCKYCPDDKHVWIKLK